LIAVQGPPSYLKVEGATTLLWVNNTESDLFRMGQTGDFYFLVAGRWFSSASPRWTVDIRHAVVAGGFQAHPR
jgi:hypothetical protein